MKPITVSEFKNLQRTMSRCKLEEKFAAALDHAGVTGYVRQFRFDETRKWKSDFAFQSRGILVEIEGGTWKGGRHRSFSGFRSDCEKYNAAAILGWRILRYTSADLLERLSECVYEVQAILKPTGTV